MVREEDAEIGEGTNIWHFAHIRKNAKIGKNCNIGKDVLLEQANFYINKLKDVHSGYTKDGLELKETLLSDKSEHETSLNNSISDLNKEIIRLEQLKASKENELSKIDEKFSPKLAEIECKLLANNVAKDNLIDSINLVVNGIKKYI